MTLIGRIRLYHDRKMNPNHDRKINPMSPSRNKKYVVESYMWPTALELEASMSPKKKLAVLHVSPNGTFLSKNSVKGQTTPINGPL